MITDRPSAASSPGSEALTSASNKPAGEPHGKSNEMNSIGLSLLTDFPMPPTMATYVTFAQQRRSTWTASSGDSRARTSPTPECPEQMEGSGSWGHAAACSSRQCVSSPKYNPNGWSLKTSKLSAFPTKGVISPPSSNGYETAGMWDSGGVWTRSISEAPAAVVVSSWSQVIAPPPIELLADAAPVDAIPSSLPEIEEPLSANSFAGYTLQAPNTRARITLGGELLVAEEGGWDQMVERERSSRDHGLRSGMDDSNFAQRWSAGNAVDPRVARWIAEKLIKVT